MSESTNDCDQTLALPVGGQAFSVGFLYTPVVMTLVGETNPMRMVLESEEITIGRSSQSDFSITDDAASRQHAKIVYSNLNKPDQRPIVHLYDLKSRNGIFVNGNRIADKVMLHDNARITIGNLQIGYYVLSFPKKKIEEGEVEGAPEANGAEAAGTPDKAGTGGVAPAAAGSSSVPAKRLCIIDQDFNFASDLRSMLEKTGRYSAIVFRNVETALRSMENNPPHMVLLDADLPGASTADFCAKLKSSEKWGPVPIILLFNKLDPERLRASLKAGAQSYLTKPISNLTLLTSRIDIHININQMMSTISSRR